MPLDLPNEMSRKVLEACCQLKDEGVSRPRVSSITNLLFENTDFLTIDGKTYSKQSPGVLDQAIRDNAHIPGSLYKMSGNFVDVDAGFDCGELRDAVIKPAATVAAAPSPSPTQPPPVIADAQPPTAPPTATELAAAPPGAIEPAPAQPAAPQPAPGEPTSVEAPPAPPAGALAWPQDVIPMTLTVLQKHRAGRTPPTLKEVGHELRQTFPAATAGVSEVDLLVRMCMSNLFFVVKPDKNDGELRVEVLHPADLDDPDAFTSQASHAEDRLRSLMKKFLGEDASDAMTILQLVNTIELDAEPPAVLARDKDRLSLAITRTLEGHATFQLMAGTSDANKIKLIKPSDNANGDTEDGE